MDVLKELQLSIKNRIIDAQALFIDIIMKRHKAGTPERERRCSLIEMEICTYNIILREVEDLIERNKCNGPDTGEDHIKEA